MHVGRRHLGIDGQDRDGVIVIDLVHVIAILLVRLIQIVRIHHLNGGCWRRRAIEDGFDISSLRSKSVSHPSGKTFTNLVSIDIDRIDWGVVSRHR